MPVSVTLTARTAIEHGIEAFVSVMETDRAVLPATARAYATDLTQFARFLHTCVAGPNLTNVAAEHIDAFVVHLRSEGRRPRTIARKLASVRALFRFLQQAGLRGDNPARQTSMPRPEPTGARLSEAQVQSLLQLPERDTFTGSRNRAILELLYGAGLRVDELLAINLSHLDLQDGRLRVQRLPSTLQGLSLGAQASAALQAYLMRRAEALVERSTEIVDAGAVFISIRGRRLHPRTVQRIVERYLRRLQAGLSLPATRHRGPTVLRDACERHMVDAGADPALVSLLLGRQSVRDPGPASSGIDELVTRYRLAHPRA